MHRRIVHRTVRRCGLVTALLLSGLAPAAGQTDDVSIGWEIANRFRLFAEQADFDIQVAALRAAANRTVLESEHRLAEDTRGQGWAANLRRLCFNSTTGKVLLKCKRDGVEEDYIRPKDLRLKLTAKLPANFGNAQCTWSIGTGSQARQVERPCDAALTDQRVAPNQRTAISVVAKSAAGASAMGSTTVEPRDVLIVGLGDSTASGEGNPTRSVALTDIGFCFRRVLRSDRQRFFLPGRARAHVVADCPTPGDELDERDAWDAAAAEWLYPQCHRSLYAYQARAAIALAVENPSLSVTYLPLACTGATIRQGILAAQNARERPKQAGVPAPRQVPSQVAQLSSYLGMTDNNRTPSRRPDLIFLSVGANDIGFSGLVANVIVTQEPERGILARGKLLVDPNNARTQLRPLGDDFKSLRSALLRFVGNDLQRVMFATCSNPAMHGGDSSCPASRRGFDAHPAFSVDGSKLQETVKFVEEEFIPKLKAYVTCESGGGCANAERDRMTYVDEHRPAFARHGFCESANDDPQFDRDCFHNGDSFKNASPGGLDRSARLSAFSQQLPRLRKAGALDQDSE
jgi:hypothetical protein